MDCTALLTASRHPGLSITEYLRCPGVVLIARQGNSSSSSCGGAGGLCRTTVYTTLAQQTSVLAGLHAGREGGLLRRYCIGYSTLTPNCRRYLISLISLLTAVYMKF